MTGLVVYLSKDKRAIAHDYLMRKIRVKKVGSKTCDPFRKNKNFKEITHPIQRSNDKLERPFDIWESRPDKADA